MSAMDHGLVETLARLVTVLGAEWVLWLLIGLSVASVAVMVERGWHFVRRRVDVDALARLLSRALADGDLGRAGELVQGGIALETRVVVDGLSELQRGAGPRGLEEAMGRAVARERRSYERALWFLGTLGNNAPFIGLFGTVLGIIKAFADLALDVKGGAGVVMAGISEALVATAVGLLVALPAVVAFNLFQKRVRATITNAEVLTRTLLVHVHERSALAAAPAAPAAARSEG